MRQKKKKNKNKQQLYKNYLEYIMRVEKKKNIVYEYILLLVP